MSSVRFCGHALRRPLVAVAAALLGTSGLVATAWAMRVSPMVAELTTTGVGSAARIEVGNVGAAPMPYETMITRMELDADENIVEIPGDENFLVFPPQGLIGVGGRQVVRVQWVGDPVLDASQSYYLWVKQLPIETSVTREEGTIGTATVQVLYTMKALIVVAPEGARPDVKVVSVEPILIQNIHDVEGADSVEQPSEVIHGVRVVVNNSGRRYALMSGAVWTLTGTDVSGNPYVDNFSSEEISEYVGVGFLPPLNGRRRFEIPTSVELDATKPIVITFSQ